MMSIKNVILAAAIAFVYVFLVGYGTNLIYNQPQWNDFCGQGYYAPEKIFEQTNCTSSAVLNKQSSDCVKSGGEPRYDYDDSGCAVSMECDFCSKEFEAAQAKYTKNLFIVSGIAGVIAIAIGALIFSIEAIGAGLMAGGVFSLIYGNIANWRNMNNLMKVIVLFIALVVLIYIGIRLNRKRR